MYRHELDRGHPEGAQVIDYDRVGDRPVRAPQLGRDLRMLVGESLHVRLVDHRFRVLPLRRPVDPPVEERIDDDRLRHRAGGILVVATVRIAEVVGEERLGPMERAVNGFRVRIEQELVRIAPVASGRIEWAVHPIAVSLTGLHARKERVPDEAVHVRKVEPLLGALSVEQAQLDSFGDLTEQREIGAGTVVGRAQGIRRSRPDLHRAPSKRWGPGRCLAAFEPARSGRDAHSRDLPATTITVRPVYWDAIWRGVTPGYLAESSSSRPQPLRGPGIRPWTVTRSVWVGKTSGDR